jgi:ketosteroid isomerase-like protein
MTIETKSSASGIAAASHEASPVDHESVVKWLAIFSDHVAAVNFAAARPFFAEDAVGFGTFSDLLQGRAAIEAEQWRKVWPTIEGFRFRLEHLKLGVSGDRRLAYALVAFDSEGIAEDGSRFPRPGRATLVLGREGPSSPWRAVHSHFSLNRGVPQRSHGRRPEAQGTGAA